MDETNVKVRKTNDEMSFKRAISTFKNRIVTIIVITLLIFGGGCAYTFLLKTPLYQSSASVILIDDETETLDQLSLAKSFAGSYAEIMKSRSLLEKVIENLKIDRKASELIKGVTVESSSSTGIIKVTVSDSDPAIAERVANRLIYEFEEEISKKYEYSNMTIVDYAEQAEKPYNMDYAKDLVIYFVVGFGVALVIVFLVFYS